MRSKTLQTIFQDSRATKRTLMKPNKMKNNKQLIKPLVNPLETQATSIFSLHRPIHGFSATPSCPSLVQAAWPWSPKAQKSHDSKHVHPTLKQIQQLKTTTNTPKQTKPKTKPNHRNKTKPKRNQITQTRQTKKTQSKPNHPSKPTNRPKNSRNQRHKRLTPPHSSSGRISQFLELGLLPGAIPADQPRLKEMDRLGGIFFGRKNKDF